MTTLDSILREPFNLRNDIDNVMLQEDHYPRNVDNAVPWKSRIYYYRKRRQVGDFLGTLRSADSYLETPKTPESKINNLKAVSIVFTLESIIVENIFLNRENENTLWISIEVQLFLYFDAKPKKPVEAISTPKLNLSENVLAGNVKETSLAQTIVVFLLNSVPYFFSDNYYFKALNNPATTSSVLKPKIQSEKLLEFLSLENQIPGDERSAINNNRLTSLYKLFGCAKSRITGMPLKSEKEVKGPAYLIKTNRGQDGWDEVFTNITESMKGKDFLGIMDEIGITDIFFPIVLKINKDKTFYIGNKTEIVVDSTALALANFSRSNVIETLIESYFKKNCFLLYPSEFIAINVENDALPQLQHAKAIDITLIDGRVFIYNQIASFIKNEKNEYSVDFKMYQSVDRYILKNNRIEKKVPSNVEQVGFLLIFALGRKLVPKI